MLYDNAVEGIMTTIIKKPLTAGAQRERARRRDLEARIARRRARIAELAVAPRPLVFADRVAGRCAHLISRDIEHPDRWRVTRFDYLGPAGHNTRADFADVLDVAWEFGANLDTAVDATPTTIDAVVAELGIVVAVSDQMPEEARALLDEIAARHVLSRVTCACGFTAEPCLGWIERDGQPMCPGCQEEPRVDAA